jgi:phage tail sheath protein FI
MAFQLSPGVNVSEIDLTTVVPAVAVSSAGMAGGFVWGPMNEVVTVANEIELVDRFGKPDANTYETFFSAANFLSYANSLRIVRAGNTITQLNATSNSAAALNISNQTVYEESYLDLSGSDSIGMFAARYPGELGNSLKASALGNSAAFAAWTYEAEFDSAPGTSTFVSNRGGANDELHIIITDEDGKFSGVPGTVLEKFAYVSKASDAKTDDGSSNYYVNVINDRSKYVYVMNHANNGTNWGNAANGTTFVAGDTITDSLGGGVDVTPSDANIQTAYDKFVNAEEVDVSLIITAGATQTVSEYVVDNIAEVRKDCVVFISPERSDVVNNAGTEVTDITTYRNLFNSSSYAFMDCNWKYQFDKYNNVYRWVPLNGDIAGLCARTDTDRDPWFSPAGLNRGQIKNVVKLAWNPSKTSRDDLYKIGVNPVMSMSGEGTILFGDKTMLAKPSAFDRINVRRLFIVLEKAISIASRYSLFEFNDEFTRAQFVALIEPFLRDVKGRRGIYDFRVVCDGTNNTPEVIDRNEFVGDIYIKPARSINFIQLNFVAVRTGVAFEEVVGRF